MASEGDLSLEHSNSSCMCSPNCSVDEMERNTAAVDDDLFDIEEVEVELCGRTE